MLAASIAFGFCVTDMLVGMCVAFWEMCDEITLEQCRREREREVNACRNSTWRTVHVV